MLTFVRLTTTRPVLPTFVAVAMLLAALAGCGHVNRALQARVAGEAATLVPAVQDHAAVVTVASAAAQDGVPAPEEWALPDQPTLEDYINEALARNPAIRRAVRDVQALGYRVPQVTSLDDPMVNLVPPIGDMVQTAAGKMDGIVGIAQKIPFPGKLGTRGRIAEQAVRMALDTLADIRIRTVAEVQKAYYRYYLADISIRITKDSEQLLRQIRDVAAARYRAGVATQQDVLRTEVELYSLANELITLGQRRATAVALLNTLMNRRVDASLPTPAPFPVATVEWKLTEAMARAAKSNPRLARLQEQITRDLEVVKLARLDHFPDLTVGYSYTFIAGSGVSPVATGDDAWNLAFGLNLPIWWQRLRARVLEGNAQVLSSVEQYEELRNLIFFGLQDTLVKIDTQYRQAWLLRDLIVPRAWQAVEVSTSAYQTGALEFTALIDNWRKWLDFSLGYHRALAELEQRFADLQQLIGLRVPRIASADIGNEEAVPAAAAPREGSTSP
jgi:cobalt-zinc-cadmium efflux system outer membrane protein